MAFGLVLLSTIGFGQVPKAASGSFELSWTKGRCPGCRIAVGLARVQFISRRDIWAVGTAGEPGEGIVVHSADAGRTWREVSRTRQYPADPDGPPAFWFLDAMRGWIAWWNAADDEPKIISTRDGGQHWREVSQESLQRIRMADDSRGYGTEAGSFFLTNDGGRSWMETRIPDVAYIDH
jgi:photosystem II stability/assembly factor-like uncharacterized protein